MIYRLSIHPSLHVHRELPEHLPSVNGGLCFQGPHDYMMFYFSFVVLQIKIIESI